MAVGAKFAESLRRLAWRTLSGLQNGSQSPAWSTKRKSKEIGSSGAPRTEGHCCKPILDARKIEALTPCRITARAMSLHNRSAKAAQRYIEIHQNLIRGSCFEAE